MELTSDALRSVRFSVHRGKFYDAREVDEFMDALLSAVERAEKQGGAADALYLRRLETVCEIRAEMTEIIMKEILRAEKRIAPYVRDENEEREVPEVFDNGP